MRMRTGFHKNGGRQTDRWNPEGCRGSQRKLRKERSHRGEKEGKNHSLPNSRAKNEKKLGQNNLEYTSGRNCRRDRGNGFAREKGEGPRLNTSAGNVLRKKCRGEGRQRRPAEKSISHHSPGRLWKIKLNRGGGVCPGEKTVLKGRGVGASQRTERWKKST